MKQEITNAPIVPVPELVTALDGIMEIASEGIEGHREAISNDAPGRMGLKYSSKRMYEYYESRYVVSRFRSFSSIGAIVGGIVAGSPESLRERKFLALALARDLWDISFDDVFGMISGIRPIGARNKTRSDLEDALERVTHNNRNSIREADAVLADLPLTHTDNCYHDCVDISRKLRNHSEIVNMCEALEETDSLGRFIRVCASHLNASDSGACVCARGILHGLSVPLFSMEVDFDEQKD